MLLFPARLCFPVQLPTPDHVMQEGPPLGPPTLLPHPHPKSQRQDVAQQHSEDQLIQSGFFLMGWGVVPI